MVKRRDHSILIYNKLLARRNAMGGAAHDVMTGIACQECGQWMEDMFKDDELNNKLWDNPPGYPRTCKDCINGAKKRKYDTRGKKSKKNKRLFKGK